MFHRIVLKEGMRLVNLKHVQEVILKGRVITYHFNDIGTAVTGVARNLVITYDTVKSAKKEFEAVQVRVLQPQAQPQPQPLV
jgi:hypothetical protein